MARRAGQRVVDKELRVHKKLRIFSVGKLPPDRAEKIRISPLVKIEPRAPVREAQLVEEGAGRVRAAQLAVEEGR